MPSSLQSRSTRSTTSAVIRIGVPPWTLGLPGPLVGGVEPHFRPQAGDGRGKIQVVHGRGFGQVGVSSRVHARADRPDDVRPVTRVDIVIHDDHQLRVEKLAQVGPDAEHDPAGVPRILFANADYRDPVRASLAGQEKIHDLGKTGSSGWARRHRSMPGPTPRVRPADGPYRWCGTRGRYGG